LVQGAKKRTAAPREEEGTAVLDAGPREEEGAYVFR